MKLLHPEVEIEPGRSGTRPTVVPVPENLPLIGSAVVRLDNPTTQENAYTVRLHCDNPFWQEAWYTVTALSAAALPNAPVISKGDQRGPQDRWVKVYVPRGGARDILIRFEVPKRPESRAGRYDYKIAVETHVTGPVEGGHRSERVRELPAIATVRPYYKWGVDLSPEQKRATRLRPGADYDVVLTNEGNDWLYCDLQLPRSKELAIECRTLRLAVPPPEPGELLTRESGQEERPGTQRTVPLRAVTKLKTFRGELAQQPLPITAIRQDAPSVAPPPGAANYTGTSAVISVNTSDTEQAPGDRFLIYAPPVPAKLTDFFTHSATSVRTLIMSVLGIILLAHLVVLAFDKWRFQDMSIDSRDLVAKPGKPLIVEGAWLIGSEMKIGNKTKGFYAVTPTTALTYDNMKHLDRVTIPEVPPDLNGQQVTIKAQRLGGWFFMLNPILPSTESIPFQVGSPQIAEKPDVPNPIDPSSAHYGDTLRVPTTGFGGQGYVTLNGTRIPDKWDRDTITFKASVKPDNATTPVKIAIVSGDGTSHDAGGYTIVDVAGNTTGAAPTTGGTTGGASAGGGGSTGGSPKPSTGGGSTGGGGTTGGNPTHQTGSGGSTGGSPKPSTGGSTGGGGTTDGGRIGGGILVLKPQLRPLTAEDFLMRQQWSDALTAGASGVEGNAVKAIADANQGNLAQADLDATAAEKLDPNNAMTLIARGWVLQKNKQHDAARAKFDAAVLSAPHGPQRVLALCSQAAAQGPGKRVGPLQNLLADPDVTSDPVMQANVNIQLGIQYLDKSVKLFPDAKTSVTNAARLDKRFARTPSFQSLLSEIRDNS